MKRLFQYCDDVEKGNIIACRWIQLAVKRFRAMYREAMENPESEYVWDQKKAQQFISFCEMTKQYKDRWAGQKLKLQPWQVFIFGNIYGFRKRKDGTRWFRKAVIFVARKAGKSSMMSPVAIFDAATVPGAECYCLATKRDQAKIVFEAVVQTIRQDPTLSGMFQNYRSSNRLVNKSNASIISPLSSDYSTMDGLNCSTAVADEIAAWKDYSLINVIESGMGARKDPFIFEITSGSDNVNSVGAQEMDLGKKCLDGVIEDPYTFYALYTIDDDDDWKDPRCYIKANPGLGVTVPLENLIQARDDALNNPQKEGEFRSKRLCSFVSPITAWISAQRWQQCVDNARTWGKDMPPLHECAATAGIDLSMRADFTAYSIYLLHVPTHRFWAKHRFYIPSEQIEDKCRRDSALVRNWIDQGYIVPAGENTIDYTQLFNDLEKDVEEYNIREVLYDPWNAGQLVNRMGDQVDLIEVRQSLKELSPFAKSWEAEVMDGTIADGNPVQRWMVSNTDLYTDPNGNIKAVKHGGKDSTAHIDGVITSLMACGRLCQLMDAGELDIRTPEQIEAEAEAFYATL